MDHPVKNAPKSWVPKMTVAKLDGPTDQIQLGVRAEKKDDTLEYRFAILLECEESSRGTT